MFGKRQAERGKVVCDYSHITLDAVREGLFEINPSYNIGIYKPYGMEMLIAYVSEL